MPVDRATVPVQVARTVLVAVEHHPEIRVDPLAAFLPRNEISLARNLGIRLVVVVATDAVTAVGSEEFRPVAPTAIAVTTAWRIGWADKVNIIEREIDVRAIVCMSISKRIVVRRPHVPAASWVTSFRRAVGAKARLRSVATATSTR